MDVKSRGIPFTMLFLFLLLSTIFSTSFSAPSSIVFKIQGNIYPLGYYAVKLAIGNPLKFYDLHIDTGSDLTWVECDAPCTHCNTPPDRQYKPNGKLMKCGDPFCAAMKSESAPTHECADPDGQCDYYVEYADQASSTGVLVRDNIRLKFITGYLAYPMLAFGCGYDQWPPDPSPSPTSGILGLGNGKTGILSQLNSFGLIRNVVGHCLSGEGGFLFFGDELIPQSRVVWTPILQSSSSEKHYKTGPADLFFDGKPTSIKGLQLIFDSGTTYTCFNSQAYKALVNLVTNDLKGKPLSVATEDQSLPLCWKGPKTFKSLNDVTDYFKPLALSFTKSKNSLLQLPLQAYLIVTIHGNVCLGILDDTENRLGDTNIIGDISLQDKMVIYDNNKHRIGWAPANCDGHSKVINESIVAFSLAVS